MPPKKILLLTFFLLIPLHSWAKTPESRPKPKEPFAVEALDGFPRFVRQAVLEVALHQNLLVEVLKIQQRAGEQLKSWIKPLPREDQKKVYQVIRYPKLLNELASDGTYQGFPKEVQGSAKYLLKNQLPLLKKIDQLNHVSDEAFENLIKDYPPETRKAYQVVLQHPVILAILSRHHQYGYLLGHIYGTQSTRGRERLTKVAPAARKKDQVVEATKKRALSQDPAGQELTAAAEKFVREADTPLDEVEDPKKAVQINIQYDPMFYDYFGAGPSLYDYPYWYGFPDWEYPYDWW